MSWNKNISDDSKAFEVLISELTCTSDVLKDVHDKTMSDDALIFELNRRLPQKYRDSFRVIKRLPEAERTFANACQHQVEDIRDVVKSDKLSAKDAAIEVSNLTKANKQQRQKQQQRGGGGRHGGRNGRGQGGRNSSQPPAQDSSYYVGGVPQNPNYSGCNVCGNKQHYQRDCPHKDDPNFKRPRHSYPAPPSAPPPPHVHFQQQHMAPPPPPTPYQPAAGRHSLGRGNCCGRGWFTGTGGGRFGRGGGAPAPAERAFFTASDGYTYAVTPTAAPMHSEEGYFHPITQPGYFGFSAVVTEDVSMSAQSVSTAGLFAGDSASTRSHCNNKDLFSAIDHTKTCSIRIADDTTVSTEGVGCVGVLCNVSYTPKFGTNLLSIAELTDMGFAVLFLKAKWLIIDASTFNVKGEGIRVGNLFWIDPKLIKPCDCVGGADVGCVADGVAGTVAGEVSHVTSTHPANNNVTWHQRTHASDDLLDQLSRLDLVSGLKLSKEQMYRKTSICDACALSKITRRQFRSADVNAPQIIFLCI